MTNQSKSNNIYTEKTAETHYLVNGENQDTTKDELTVKDILKQAGKPASIDTDQIDQYILENINTGEKYSDLSTKVKIEEGESFIAIHSGPTPVA